MWKCCFIICVVFVTVREAQSREDQLLVYCEKFEEKIDEINRNQSNIPAGMNLISSDVDCEQQVFSFTWHLEPGRMPSQREEAEFRSSIVASTCKEGQGWREALQEGWRIVANVELFGQEPVVSSLITECP
jgi:hypothetical protein